ncbi:MAG: ATP-binding cassette domain-containing protein [Alphaproteobacteria bacterium]|nr:ATP-binding cassette domain-containing protein [Alphaproteobacteria bacterium]
MLVVEQLQRLGFGPFDLTVAPGECVGIAGPSGAGKSVFLRMIADLDPHAGSARLDDRRCADMPAPAWRRLVTYVPAESGWWAETVGEHFADRAAAAALLPRVLLGDDVMGWPVSRLSTGEKQRLALIRALIQQPRALLLDEPTAALDPAATQAVERLLAEALARDTAIVLVSHDAHQAQRLARRRFRMEAGRLHPEAAVA